MSLPYVHVIVLSNGSSFPKYFLAILSEMIIPPGSFKAVEGSPFKSLNENI